MSKTLQADHQRYYVQCCIADPSFNLDSASCRLGMTGRAEINRIFKHTTVWFTPDGGSKAYPMPITALMFGSEAIDAMPEYYRYLLAPLRPHIEIVPKNPKAKKLKRTWRFKP